jgi:hypothetical protein
MTSFYSLWDIESRNLIEEFDDGVAALRAAAELIELNRPVYPDALLLRWTGPNGDPHDIVHGPVLDALSNSVGSQEELLQFNMEGRRSRIRRVTSLRRRRHVIRAEHADIVTGHRELVRVSAAD